MKRVLESFAVSIAFLLLIIASGAQFPEVFGVVRHDEERVLQPGCRGYACQAYIEQYPEAWCDSVNDEEVCAPRDSAYWRQLGVIPEDEDENEDSDYDVRVREI
jgi:hypothetical protein